MIPQVRLEARFLTLLAFALVSFFATAAHAEEPLPRTAEHQQFAEQFWSYLSDKYPTWQTTDSYPASAPRPEAGTEGTIYWNEMAAHAVDEMAYGSILVIEHQHDGKPHAVSALFRPREGVNQKNNDWYELYYLADGTVVKTSADQSKFNRRGFITKQVDGRIWVLPLQSNDVAKLIHGDGPEKHVTLPGAGPDRKTIKSDSRETALQYLFTRPGFVTHFEQGRAWVFAKHTDAAKAFSEDGLPEKHVTRIGAGPMRTTIKAPDADTIDKFLGKPGQ